MPATEDQYDQKSKAKGFPSEGARVDYVEALEAEYTNLSTSGSGRADMVADELVRMGESDPRPKRSRATAQTREA